jgi:hypothetical protein
MRAIFNRIINSEFLTFNEVLRLKVSVVTVFVFIFTAMTFPLYNLNNIRSAIAFPIIVALGLLIILTIVLLFVNLNRWAMHVSIYTIMILTVYYVNGSTRFYGYMLFFVTLTVIIFYQDILTYLLYGIMVLAYGIYYIVENGYNMVGVNSSGLIISAYTYQAILIAFYVVFLVQFIVSDNIYEKLNNEYVRMNKVLGKYQSGSLENLIEIVEKLGKEPLYKSTKFHQAVNEICTFTNEFFEEDGDNIAEVVEFYFFLHDVNIDEVLQDASLPRITREYAVQLQKYLLNERSELVSILFDFSTLFKGDDKFNEKRYEYSLDKLFTNKTDKLLSLSILYKFLKSEKTQIDKFGKIGRELTHEEIVDMFISKEFREFISYEQVNFFLDNQELFNKYL